MFFICNSLIGTKSFKKVREAVWLAKVGLRIEESQKWWCGCRNWWPGEEWRVAYCVSFRTACTNKKFFGETNWNWEFHISSAVKKSGRLSAATRWQLVHVSSHKMQAFKNVTKTWLLWQIFSQTEWRVIVALRPACRLHHFAVKENMAVISFECKTWPEIANQSLKGCIVNWYQSCF